MIRFIKYIKNNQSAYLLLAHFLLILLVFVTTSLYGYSRMSTYLRKEAFELFPTHIWVENTLYQDKLSTEELTYFLQSIPKDHEYIYVYNRETSSKALYCKDNTQLHEGFDGINLLLVQLLNKMIRYIDLGDVYNIYINQNLKIELSNNNNTSLIRIGHEVETDAFSGEIIAYRNVTKALLMEFKITLFVCILFIGLSVLFIIINYKVMENLYFNPLTKMREHYMKMSRFHLEIFSYKKPVLPEVKKTINTVNETMLELQDGLKETKSFLDEVVHEIKNPAHNIKNEAEFIEEFLPEGDWEMKQSLQSIMNETENITSLLSSIKIVYDIYYLGGSPPDIWVNPVEKIEPIFKEYQKKHPDRQFHFKHHINPNITLWIDHGSIELMIRNLLDNAIKYSKAGSTIFIGIREQLSDQTVLIDVINSDSSIEYHNIGKVFGKYYRTKKAKEQTGGAGIGLWLIKSITEIYDATINVQSSTDMTGFVIVFKHYKREQIEKPMDEAISS